MIDDRRKRRGDSARVTGLDRDALIALYRTVVRIREFEEQVHRSFLSGLVHGTTHLCQGQEAVAAGAIAALRDDDYVTYTYRGHGEALEPHQLARIIHHDEHGAHAFVFLAQQGSNAFSASAQRQ